MDLHDSSISLPPSNLTQLAQELRQAAIRLPGQRSTTKYDTVSVVSVYWKDSETSGTTQHARALERVLGNDYGDPGRPWPRKQRPRGYFFIETSGLNQCVNRYQTC